MYSSLDTYSHNSSNRDSHYNSFTIDTNPEWDGQRSQKFARTKKLLPNRDLIRRGNIKKILQDFICLISLFLQENIIMPISTVRNNNSKDQKDKYNI